jgi:DNA polymerase III delta prime subunit
MERIPIKYKPNTLHDFFFHENSAVHMIIRTLLQEDNINILFVGNSNCGKTTLLNIIIREYYNLSSTDHLPETDILYINNLKEQGISFFRSEMKTHSQSKCTIFGKKKLIIIDDIDFINEQNQQTFRNYIDKFKHNVQFISVCSNIQKVIESYQSRVHIIKLDVPTMNQLHTLTLSICKNENIHISEDAITYLLHYCKHSIRLLINQIEKFYVLDSYITLELCTLLCTEINTDYFILWINHLVDNQLSLAINILYKLYSFGYSVVDIYDYLYNFIKETTLLDDNKKYLIIPLFCKYITIFYTIHEDVVELALFTNNVYTIIQHN